MSNGSNCPCDAFLSPEVIDNSPGLPAIRYRAGDFVTFREALLQALPGEVELANWKPTASGDLALQMIEWWAYLGDILTFYNERIANEDYLRTAVLDQSVLGLVGLLGYRPRPGIGATATLAALVSAKLPFTLLQGFAVQSKPGPGSSPQIFELSANTALQPLDHVSADPEPSQAALGADGTVLLQGTVSSIKPGDLLLLVEKGWSGTDPNYVVANVVKVNPQTTPRGTTNTQVVFSSALPLPSGASPANYRLLRSAQTARLFQYGVSLSLSLLSNQPSTGTGTADLDSVVRQIEPGDLILFDSSGGQFPNPVGGSSVAQTVTASPVFIHQQPMTIREFSLQKFRASPGIRIGSSSGSSFMAGSGVLAQAALAPPPHLAAVNTYKELIWYADNSTAPATPGKIAVLHSEITFTPSVSATDPTTLVVRYGWQDVGTLIPAPSPTFTGSPAKLQAVSPPNFPSVTTPILLEDANGAGESATGSAGTDITTMRISGLPPSPPSLTAPINVLYNLLQVTRGKTVTNEALGSGDASVADQQFVLSKSPLTYLAPTSTSRQAYVSTLQIQVNSIYWTEVPSFYGQPANAAVFVTREDGNQQTHVMFGDGVNGARLPTGLNNVIANYRFGSGAAAPAGSTLTVIVTPQPGLTAIRNPVGAGGGADPQPSSQSRKYAPLSALAFGRAVSGNDYEAIAASTGSVNRARAIWQFDPVQQRSTVTVYVGDDQGAVNAAQAALAAASDPNRAVTVLLAQPISVQLTLTLEIDTVHVRATVVAAAQQALIDPDLGLFGTNRIGIGEIIYRSQIFAACLSVPGALAVHGLQFGTIETGGAGLLSGYRFDPGTGYWFSLDSNNLTITPEVSPNAG